MSEIVKTEQQQIAKVDTKQISKYLDLYGFKDIPETEKQQFTEVCMLNGLNPFKREAYISAYGDGKYRQFAIITGYEVYIKRAEMSGRLNGWHPSVEQCQSVKVDENGNISYVKDVKGIVTIYRKDFDKPFVHEVKLSAYLAKTKAGKVTKFWQKDPEGMIKKVAISQGFRMCFNEILGGMPYASEEMGSFEEVPQKPEGTVTIEKVSKIEILEDSEQFNDLAAWLSKPNNDIDKIKQNYSITDIVLEKLVQASVDIQIENENKQ